MRRTKNVTIEDDGEALHFTIKQMPAMALIRWTAKAMSLMYKADAAAPEAADPLTFAATLQGPSRQSAFAKLFIYLNMDEAQPLFDELLACCQHISAPNSMTRLSPEVVEGIISSPHALLNLQYEALMFNLDFLLPGGILNTQGENPSGSHQIPLMPATAPSPQTSR